MPGKNDCREVDKDSEGLTPGIIHPNACCNNWEPDAERAGKSTEELLKQVAFRGPPARVKAEEVKVLIGG